MNSATKVPKNIEGNKIRPVGAVKGAIKVLRCLSDSSTPKGATEVARATGLHTGTCYQILQTLVQDNLLLFDKKEKKYSLSTSLFGLTSTTKALAEPNARVLHKTAMSVLANKFDTTIYLIGRLHGDGGVLIEFAHPPSHPDRPVLGSYETIYVGAMGRIATFILNKDSNDWKGRFDLMTWENAPDYRTWYKEVQAIGTQGYAVDHGHRTKGQTVVAAPICDNLGEIMMFLAALYPASIPNNKFISKLGLEVRICAEEIRHNIAIQSLSETKIRIS